MGARARTMRDGKVLSAPIALVITPGELALIRNEPR